MVLTKLSGGVFAFLCLLASLPVANAQYRGSGDTTYEYAGAATRSLTGGVASITASAGEAGSGRPVATFDGASGFGVRLAGKSAVLTAGFASGDLDSETVAAEFSFGPRITPYAMRGEKWVGVHIPIRFAFGYNYLRPTNQPVLDENGQVVGEEGGLPYHFGRGGLGLGLSLDGGLATQSKVAREVSGSVSFVLTPGVTTDFSESPFEETFAQRSSEVDIEIRASSVGGSGIGLALGYTLQTTLRSTDSIEEVQDVVDAISAADFQELSRFGMFRVGLAF